MNIRTGRRKFLRDSLALGGAAFTAPIFLRAETLGLGRRTPPSERIRTGHIGIGTQGGGHLLGGAWTHIAGGYAGRDDTQVLAVCDIRKSRREERCARVNAVYAEKLGVGKFKACEAYADFRELLARPDIDAVVIACPIHWHAMIATMAVEAGKDVYCEKPIAPTIQQGRALVDAVNRFGRVYQAGTQQRSEWASKFRFVCELVRSGRIGELKEVYAYKPGGSITWPGQPIGAPQPAPDGIDWELYLGWMPFFPCDGNVGTFRFQYGDINWTPHHFDFAQWVLDADRTGPTEIWMDHDAPAFRFPNGVVMYGRPFPGEPVGNVGGACFVGTRGRIAVDRDNIAADPPGLLKEPVAPGEVRLYRSDSHANNFIHCVRTRQTPVADVETAQRAISLVLLGGIVMQLRRPLKWDFKTETFPGDDEANRLLSFATRPPWRI